MPASILLLVICADHRQAESPGIALIVRRNRPDNDDGEVVEMGTEENAELVRRGYEAFNAGDMATLNELFAEDAVWDAPGNGALSGRKEGRDAILAYFKELGTRSGGQLKVTLQDVVAGENHTVGLHHNQAENKGRSLDTDGAVAFRIRGGKIIEGREFFADTAQGDAFWA